MRFWSAKESSSCPDILANAGGVDRQLFRMGAESAGRPSGRIAEVNQKLDFVMRRAFNDVYMTMRKHHTHSRAAAYVLAVSRVAEATLVRGLFP